MKPSLVVYFAALCALGAAVWSIDLEYSMNDDSKTYPLGRIELKRSFDGNYTGSFRSLADAQLSERLNKFSEGLYKVKATTSSQPGKLLLSSTKPCLLLQSNLFHEWWVSVDGDRQLVHSVTIFPDPVATGGTLDSQVCQQSEVLSGDVKGIVHVQTKSLLPSPDTASFVMKMERERRTRQHGAETDNRSFLAKYWMYIVPVVVFMLISNAMTPPEEGAQ